MVSEAKSGDRNARELGKNGRVYNVCETVWRVEKRERKCMFVYMAMKEWKSHQKCMLSMNNFFV